MEQVIMKQFYAVMEKVALYKNKLLLTFAASMNQAPVATMDQPYCDFTCGKYGSNRHLRSFMANINLWIIVVNINQASEQTSSKLHAKKTTIHLQMSFSKINVSKFRKKVANLELIDYVYSQLQAINPIKMSFGLNFILAKQSKRSKNNPFHEICSSSLWGHNCVRISAWFCRHLFLARIYVEPAIRLPKFINCV